MIHVKVTKLESLDGRPNGTLVDWNADTTEITKGYWIVGHTVELPKVGERFNVDRYIRNGVEILGEFTTSPVQEVLEVDGKTRIRTENSVYEIEVLK